MVLNVTMITEISIRVCAMGKEFWQYWWNLLDAGVSPIARLTATVTLKLVPR